MTSMIEKKGAVIDELPFGYVLLLYCIVDDKQKVKEKIQLELANKLVLLGPARYLRHFPQPCECVSEKKDYVVIRGITKEFISYVVDAERSSVYIAIVRDEHPEEIGLFIDPTLECLIDFVIVETD